VRLPGEIAQDAYVFNAGMVCVKDGDTGLYGISDKSGGVIVAPMYEKMEVYHFDKNPENMVIASYRTDGKVEMLDKNGKKHVDVAFDSVKLTEMLSDWICSSEGELDFWWTFEGPRGLVGETGTFQLSRISTKMQVGEFEPTVIVMANRQYQETIKEELELAQRAVEHLLKLGEDFVVASEEMIETAVVAVDFDKYGELVNLPEIQVWQHLGSTRSEVVKRRARPEYYTYSEEHRETVFDDSKYKAVVLKTNYNDQERPRNMGVDFLKNADDEWEILGVYRLDGN